MDFPHNGPVRWSFDVLFGVTLYKLLNKQSSCCTWDVNVMAEVGLDGRQDLDWFSVVNLVPNFCCFLPGWKDVILLCITII